MHGKNSVDQTSNLGAEMQEAVKKASESIKFPWIPGLVGRDELRLVAERQKFPKVAPPFIFTL